MPRTRRVLFAWLWCWRKALVNPSVKTMMTVLQVDRTTVQRHLRALQRDGYIDRRYNGGRGKPAICIMGPKVLQVVPRWELDYERDGKKLPVFGGLGMGDRKLARLGLPTSKGGTGAALTDDRSSSVREDSSSLQIRESQAAPPPRAEGRPALELCQGGRPASAGPACVGSSPPPRPSSPPPPASTLPTKGKRSSSGTGSGNGEPRPPFEKIHPRLWKTVFAIWREMYAIAHQQPNIEDVRDRQVLRRLCWDAYYETGRDEEAMLRRLAWSFWCYVRDRWPHGAHRSERHPIWRLGKLRQSYGQPAPGWTIPTADELADMAAKRRPIPPMKSPSRPPEWVAVGDRRLAPATELERARQGRQGGAATLGAVLGAAPPKRNEPIDPKHLRQGKKLATKAEKIAHLRITIENARRLPGLISQAQLDRLLATVAELEKENE